MLQISIVLFGGNLLSEKILMIKYFSSESSEFLTNDLIKSLIFIHSYFYYNTFLIFSLLLLIEPNTVFYQFLQSIHLLC